MNQYFTLILLLFLVQKHGINAQTYSYQISTVAFYNLENLFDSIDNPTTFDNDYTPNGNKNWTQEKIATKLDNLSYVISQIGLEKSKLPPAIIGISEVENRNIIQQLISNSNLSNTDYGIAHFNSPDRRGIDVALLYDRQRFKLTNSVKHQLLIQDKFGKRIYTRDQLCVSGFLGEDLVYCIVNHWPSRRGGEKRSRYKRVEAAKLCLKITDSIYRITPKANIIIMGDFNDDPTNQSIKKILNTQNNRNYNSNTNYFFNPMEHMKKRGLGTLAYRDKWNIFDQLLFSNTMIDSIGIQLYKTAIFSPKFLVQNKGKYKGYPKRTTTSEIGYSDHFPVYSYLIKRIK